VYANLRIEELHVQQDQVRGTTDLRLMSTGGLFELDNHPRSDQNKEYLVIDTAYEISLHADDGGMVYQCQFTAIDSQTPFRPARVTRKPVVQGPQTAIVVGPDGEDIWPDKYGRVKIQFHWDREGQDEDRKENSSCWVRVSQNWAGKGWGGMFLPHVDHEVIVSFLEGDPDKPIITGRVYNAVNMPADTLPDNKTKSIIHDHGDNKIILEGVADAQFIHIKQSCGNEILLDGKKDEPSILVKQCCGNSILMEGKSGSEKITLTDAGGKNTVTMDPNLPSIRLQSEGNHSEWEMGIGSNGKSGFQKKTDGDWYEHTSGNKVKTMLGSEESFNASAKSDMTIGVTNSTFVGLKLAASKALDVSINKDKKLFKDKKVEQTLDKYMTVAAKQYIKHSVDNESTELHLTKTDALLAAGESSIQIEKDKDIIIASKTKVNVNGPDQITLSAKKGEIKMKAGSKGVKLNSTSGNVTVSGKKINLG